MPKISHACIIALLSCAAGSAVAASHGYLCRWQLVEVPGVGHDSAGMFASQQAYRALR